MKRAGEMGAASGDRFGGGWASRGRIAIGFGARAGGMYRMGIRGIRFRGRSGGEV